MRSRLQLDSNYTMQMYFLNGIIDFPSTRQQHFRCLPRTWETHHTTDLWRRVHARLTEPKPSSTISVLVNTLWSHRKPSDGVAFIPLHGANDGDGSEVDMGLFLEHTHMTRGLDCFGRLHGCSLCPWGKLMTHGDSRSRLFLRHLSWKHSRIQDVAFTVQLFTGKRAGSEEI